MDQDQDDGERRIRMERATEVAEWNPGTDGTDGAIDSLLKLSVPEGLIGDGAPIAQRIGRSLLARVSADVDQALGRVLDADEAAAFRAAALSYARERLDRWLVKTAVFEINLAREAGRLHGDSSEARLRAFVALLDDVGFQRELMLRNRVLFERVEEHFRLLVGFLTDAAARLGRRRPRLHASFGDLGRLVEVEIGKGDSHFGARQVLILRFTDGALVFKPRSLAVDRLYAELIERANRHLRFALRAPVSLDDDDAGWQELVASGIADGAVEAERFYYSIGAHLALMHLVNATDVHFENILTTPAGEPIFFDMETAFANMVAPDPARIRRAGFDAVMQQLQALSRSVLMAGILPSYSNQQSGLSALTEADGRETLTSVDHVVDNGTDRVRLERKPARFEIRSSLPRIKGVPTRPAEFVETILAGFDDAYRWIRTQRDDLLAWLDGHGRVQVRAVLRNTSIYGMFLSESTHPRFGADPDGLRRLLGKLAIGAEFLPPLANVLDEEVEQLLRMDVPAFRCRLDQPTLDGYRTSDLPFYGRSALQNLHDNAAHLSDSDQRFQQMLIRRMLGVSSYPRGPWCGRPDDAAPASIAAIVAFLRAAASESSRDGSVSWLNINVPEEGGEIQPVTPTLYGGLAGIFHFLSAVERETSLLQGSDLVDRLRRMVMVDAEEMAREQRNPGFFNGLAGLLFALQHDALARNDTVGLAAVVRMVDRLEPAAFAGKTDIVDGLAGTVLFLCGLHEASPVPGVRARLVAMAEALDLACRDGFAWSEAHQQFLGGFAHGASGIAHALLSAGHVLGSEALVARGRAAIVFEDARFEPRLENWPDLRVGTAAIYNRTWCNGRPGYLIPRAIWSDVMTPDDRRISDLALRRQLEGVDYDDDSLCHGSAGGLDVAITLRRWLPDRMADFDLGRALTALSSRVNLRSGSIDRDAPGLMSGAAGFGHALLRARNPALPSVLSIYR